ncbi:catechol 2,3-dioxygenase-like lactoylglutathione lyase family enzyme [Pseudomonas sp. GGS8]|jgi:catechol 2,3-dioxygenase-like lactoylglutathione lyase family enzyme|uniref:VOC family protein n=1 Tax=Pseudomonas sp. GGS8 TaxID=2817892 RepID=UPI0020A1C8E3|nr:VOC family protein [Pseudomonas sp. GGS8]MCP1446315.1 catechol 2,3-dioxygenase-like lactoylglutathione lyase family enzyme [Pseudomonas sp. GGS8]
MSHLHLAIRTNKPEQMISFYRDIFKFDVIEEFAAGDGSFHLYFLSDNKYPKLELIVNAQPFEEPEAGRMSHYGFFVEDSVRILEASTIANLSILDEKQVNGFRQFYITDPDGNYVEVNQV